MKTFILNDFTEDGVLSEIETAEFLAKKFGTENRFDFSEIKSVSPAFIDALFDKQKIEDLDGRIIGLSDEISQALEGWIQRQKIPVPSTPKINKKTSAIKVRKAPPLEYERAEFDGERFTPTRLMTRLRRQLTGYIESAYPLSDPILVRARRKLLEEAKNGHLLAQEPYVESTPKYRGFSGGYGDLGIPQHIAAFFSMLAETQQQYAEPQSPRTILYPGMYEHQAESFSRFIRDGKDVIVATGTGSGKTECFLVPMLGCLYDEACTRPESFAKSGVRVIILYPMNALVNDQLSRLRLLFGDIGVAKAFHELGDDSRHPTFGMYTGRTPYPGPRTANKDRERVRPLMEYYLSDMDDELRNQLKRLGRFPAKNMEAFYAKQFEVIKHHKTGKNQGSEYTEHNWSKRLHTQPGDRELLTRQEMVKGTGTNPGNSPDILVTNYSMLEYMLMRPFERPIFAQTADWLSGEKNQLLLILDEAHMYRGAKGAEVAFLLRRLQARLGIHDRPDKMRVICTSASLGSSEKALENIRCFAADLTGKKPDTFVTVVGKRAILKAIVPNDTSIADILAAIDMDHLHAAASLSELQEALTPLFDYLNAPCLHCISEDDLLSHLYRVLSDNPFVNLLLKETAESALALSSLADALFPGHLHRVKATEALITLGTIARLQKDEPGLIPTRIHALFRGLNALYACTNAACTGRQDHPGEVAMLGKLFVEPRTCCDACGSRVFEMASCRSCGSPYLHAYARESSIANLDFLWGEMEGNLSPLQLLPTRPRYEEATEELRVHLTTGYIDREHTFPDEEVRSLWIFLDGNHQRLPKYDRCAMCQPPGTRSKSRIHDFRTKGEQPFTALIDAQFAEQPPQKADKRLPNRGRKVLVFSDGRQKAARLAPALEYSHARDLFRQVIALGSYELSKQTPFSGMEKLYPAVLWVCNTRGINLFPAPDESEFHEHQRRSKGKSLEELVNDLNNGFLRPTQSYAKALFDELTDRYYSLNSLALSTVEEDPLVRTLFKDFPSVGLSGEEIQVIFRSWVRLQLEARRFLPQGADISNLGEGWERPEGISPNNVAQLFPRPFGEYLRKIFNDEKRVKAVEDWFKEFVRSKGLCRLENDLYFLQPLGLSLVLKLDAAWLCCKDCGRLHAQTIANICPACLGEVLDADPDYLDARNGYYRQQVQRAMDGSSLEPFGLITAEHSAQLSGQDDQEAFSKTEKYELRFQDIPIGKSSGTAQDELPIDVLSCTTTMEVGIDIGTLSGVALRNVPPHVANYQQRAGRAGRRGRSVASVLTYAHGTSHDSYYFDNPEKIISGEVQAPIVYIENQQVLGRHINAYLVQRFFHETVQEGSDLFRLFEALGSVEQFLSDEFPCSLYKLEEWLHNNQTTLEKELEQWSPAFCFGSDGSIPDVKVTVSTAIEKLISALHKTLPVEEYAHREELDGVDREVLVRRLEEGLLATLIGRAIFPRYAFPTDVVSFWVSRPKRRGDPAYKRTFDYDPQRDLQIALSEYAPGASLTIDKWRFSSAALFSPYAIDVNLMLERAQSYTSCPSCGYVSLQESAASAASCPCCGNTELFRQSFIRPQGFAPDINVKPEVDKGQAPDFAGRASRAQLEVQEPPEKWDIEINDGRLAVIAGPRNLVTVNKGIGDRGFIVCPNCGRSEAVFGPGYPNSIMFKGEIPRQHHHPLEQGVMCDGHAIGPFYFGHSFLTDVMLLRVRVAEPVVCSVAHTAERSGRPGQVALTSFVEALCLAASNTLQIEEGELSGNWCPVLGRDSRDVHVFLYDLLPGGAGYTKLVRDNLETVLDETERLLYECTCESSCYSCIRHYSNNFLHSSLDRLLAYALLKHLRTGSIPALTPQESQGVLSPLIDLLRLQDYKTLQNEVRDGVNVPLVIRRPSGAEVWVQAHHPLVDELLIPSPVRKAAEAAFVEFCSLDAFMLRHDLPNAFSKLQL